MRPSTPLSRALGALATFLCLGACLAAAQTDDLVFRPAPPQSSVDSRLLLDVTAAGDRLLAVGGSGLVIYRDHSDGPWQQASVPVSATLTSVYFADATHGWAVGHAGVILHSSDGGGSWQRQFDGYRANEAFQRHAAKVRAQLEDRVAGLQASDDADPAELEELEISLEDAVFAEEDAALAVETGPADPFLDVAFRDPQRGFAVGAYGMLYRTADGGETWDIHVGAVENPYRYHLYSVLVQGDVVYIAGEGGLLFRSDDGGETFQRFYDVYDGSLFGLLPLGEGVIAYGLRGNVFYQARGSDDWERLELDNETSLYGGGALSDGGVVLLGAGGQLVQLDAGRAATFLQHPARSTLSAAYQDGSGTVWLVGIEGLMTLSEATVR
jgi:photosystem II stability/assembly factor-like uncharacterized protein